MICTLAAGLAMAVCEPDVLGPPMPAVAGEDCPVERAVYDLHLGTEEPHELTIMAGFVPARGRASAASDLYLWVETVQRRYWFVVNISMGYSVVYIEPVTDPTRADAERDGPRKIEAADGPPRTSTLLMFDAEVLPVDVPSVGDPAPAWFLVPDLGLALWYAPGDLTDQPVSERERMPIAFFRRTGCLDEPPAPAWP